MGGERFVDDKTGLSSSLSISLNVDSCEGEIIVEDSSSLVLLAWKTVDLEPIGLSGSSGVWEPGENSFSEKSDSEFEPRRRGFGDSKFLCCAVTLCIVSDGLEFDSE